MGAATGDGEARAGCRVAAAIAEEVPRGPLGDYLKVQPEPKDEKPSLKGARTRSKKERRKELR